MAVSSAQTSPKCLTSASDGGRLAVAAADPQILSPQASSESADNSADAVATVAVARLPTSCDNR
jgi:hypothetical protein